MTDQRHHEVKSTNTAPRLRITGGRPRCVDHPAAGVLLQRRGLDLVCQLDRDKVVNDNVSMLPQLFHLHEASGKENVEKNSSADKDMWN